MKKPWFMRPRMKKISAVRGAFDIRLAAPGAGSEPTTVLTQAEILRGYQAPVWPTRWSEDKQVLPALAGKREDVPELLRAASARSSLPEPFLGSSPRPWRRNLAYSRNSMAEAEHSPILDANGGFVLEPSEWLTMSDADIDLIVAAVNRHGRW